MDLLSDHCLRGVSRSALSLLVYGAMPDLVGWEHNEYVALTNNILNLGDFDRARFHLLHTKAKRIKQEILSFVDRVLLALVGAYHLLFGGYSLKLAEMALCELQTKFGNGVVDLPFNESFNRIDKRSLLSNAVCRGKLGLARVLLKLGADDTPPIRRFARPNMWNYGFTGGVGNFVGDRRAFLKQHAQWRPLNHYKLPAVIRGEMYSLIIMAKARTVDANDASVYISHFPQTCLDRLPEEILQWLLVFVCAALMEYPICV